MQWLSAVRKLKCSNLMMCQILHELSFAGSGGDVAGCHLCLVCRKDMLDEALLRPGRLEVQVEIGLADEKGRHQILQVGQPT